MIVLQVDEVTACHDASHNVFWARVTVYGCGALQCLGCQLHVWFKSYVLYVSPYTHLVSSRLYNDENHRGKLEVYTPTNIVRFLQI